MARPRKLESTPIPSFAAVVVWALIAGSGFAHLTPAAAAGDPSRASRLIEFDMEDQFGNRHRHDDFSGYVLVLIGSDRGGSSYNSLWGKAIQTALEENPGLDRLRFLPVADLRGVPFFLKKMVKGKFPKEPEKWTLTDWKGRFAKAYSFEPEASNILVFAPDGRLMHHAHGTTVHSAKLANVVYWVRAAAAHQ